ncbi:MAG: hypothetical protein ABMA14_10740 [Hyphomonadaceae bacterium]
MPRAETHHAKAIELVATATRHVREVLHRSITFRPLTRPGSSLGVDPGWLLAHATIGGQPCALATVINPGTPDAIAQDINRIERALEKLTVAVLPAITSSDRSRLVQRGVPFIVADSQIYIPQLALDLRETFKVPVSVYKGGLTPATQAVLFHMALAGLTETTPTVIALALDFTPMSAGRAIDELAAHGLGEVERVGREKVFRLSSARTAIHTSRELLRPPARGVYGVRFGKRRPKMLQAGETALTALTGVKIEPLPTYAIPSLGRETFFKEHEVETHWEIEAAHAIIETWRYDPAILSKGPQVDPLSLYAQFWNNPDPLLSGAAEDLLTRTLG